MKQLFFAPVVLFLLTASAAKLSQTDMRHPALDKPIEYSQHLKGLRGKKITPRQLLYSDAWLQVTKGSNKLTAFLYQAARHNNTFSFVLLLKLNRQRLTMTTLKMQYNAAEELNYLTYIRLKNFKNGMVIEKEADGSPKMYGAIIGFFDTSFDYFFNKEKLLKMVQQSDSHSGNSSKE